MYAFVLFNAFKPVGQALVNIVERVATCKHLVIYACESIFKEDVEKTRGHTDVPLLTYTFQDR